MASLSVKKLATARPGEQSSVPAVRYLAIRIPLATSVCGGVITNIINFALGCGLNTGFLITTSMEE